MIPVKSLDRALAMIAAMVCGGVNASLLFGFLLGCIV
jgi:hypothetical protein